MLTEFDLSDRREDHVCDTCLWPCLPLSQEAQRSTKEQRSAGPDAATCSPPCNSAAGFHLRRTARLQADAKALPRLGANGCQKQSLATHQACHGDPPVLDRVTDDIVLKCYRMACPCLTLGPKLSGLPKDPQFNYLSAHTYLNLRGLSSQRSCLTWPKLLHVQRSLDLVAVWCSVLATQLSQVGLHGSSDAYRNPESHC